MLKKISILSFMIIFLIYQTVLGEERYFTGKVISLESITYPEPGEDEEMIKEIKNFKIKFSENKERLVGHPVFYEDANNIDIDVGDSVVLLESDSENESGNIYIADRDKRSWMVGLVSIFLLLTLFIAKFKGVKALFALLTTGFLLIKFLIPGIIMGYSPIILSTGLAFFSSVLTIFLMSGFSPKGYSALLGCLTGVFSAGLLSLLFSNLMGLTGFSTIEVINMSGYLSGIRVKEIISAGIILGSMGAVMDVAMSIASALSELKYRDKELTSGEMFISGMNIGSDIIGTMVNTLILAYLGSSLISMILIALQGNEYPLIRLLNFEFIAVEILRSLCGSIGILVAVPATSYFSKLFHSKSE
ncbi:MAG: YibE/F family protein [Fusobacteriaceae bacterium]